MQQEKMAEKVHDIWCSWMSYLFSVSEPKGDGTFVIPVGLTQRWHRQIYTPYNELPDHERESDRRIAREILDLIDKK